MPMRRRTTRRVKHRSGSYQTGSSNTKADKRYKAQHPGKRVSKKGKTYYEHRKNRSDRNITKRL